MSTQATADKVSTIEVAAALIIDAIVNRHAIVRTIERDACAAGAAEITKRIIHERRPDGSDDKSFFSEHTALAAVASTPHGAGFGISITFSVASLRVIARKHFPLDTFVGAAVGAGCARIP